MPDAARSLLADGAAQPMTKSDSTDVDWLRTLRLLDVGVVIQDRDLRIVFANDRATALLGLATAEFVDRTTNDPRWDVVTPDGHPVPPDEHPGPLALRTGHAIRGHVLGVRSGEATERVWIQVSAVPEFDASGTVDRVVITFSDVTVAHRAHRVSEATYQSVFRSVSEGLVIHNVDGTIRAANQAAERVLGLTIDQMAGRHPLDPRWRLVHTDGEPVEQEAIPSEITTRTGQPAHAVLGVHRPSGELAWLEVRADPMRESGDSTLTGVVASFTDITAEREATLALETSRAQVQRVLDAVPGVVFQYLHDLEGRGRFTFMAGRVREVLGLEVHDARRDPYELFERLEPDERRALEAAVAHAVEHTTRIEHEATFVHPENGRVWVRFYGVPATTPAGLLYTGVLLDVTAEHQMADALRRRQRREAMGEMAGGIAHNFNNMLAVILPNIQMAREQASPEQESHLADAERAAFNASDLVRRMLELGRADAAESSQQVDLVRLVRDAVHICRQTFDRAITIVDDVHLPSAYVQGSSSSTQQVILNLLFNARDAMQGVPNATLTVQLTQDGRDGVQLVVRDTGSGMSEDTLRRLGEPFFTTKPPGRGTGLGLASAFHAITEAGGTWRVESAVGKGTTFTVRLPLADRAGSRTPSEPRPILKGTQGTVLVIDDEPMVRTALARQIKQVGMTPVTADGAADGLRLIREGIDDLRVILLDLSMPGMSGVEALPLLRETAPGIPVVALSGHVPGDFELDGAAAVLQKPLGMRQLVAALVSVIPS